MRVLVTGATGFVGYAVAARLCRDGHEVWGLARSGGRLPDGVGRIVGDVRDDAAVRAAFAQRFDAVCHLAALVRVRDSRADPVGYWRTNVGGTLAVLEALAAQEGPPARLVVASTCAVYGEQGAVPITEDAPTQPTHPYGREQARRGPGRRRRGRNRGARCGEPAGVQRRRRSARARRPRRDTPGCEGRRRRAGAGRRS